MPKFTEKDEMTGETLISPFHPVIILCFVALIVASILVLASVTGQVHGEIKIQPETPATTEVEEDNALECVVSMQIYSGAMIC